MPNNQDDQDEHRQAEAPLSAMHSSSSNYAEYMARLKAGGSSGITGTFGTVSLSNASARLNAVSQRLKAFSENSPAEERQTAADSGKVTRMFTVEDKVGAVYAILSGALDVEAVSNTYGADPASVAHWLEVACRAIEDALKNDSFEVLNKTPPQSPSSRGEEVTAPKKSHQAIEAPAHLNIMSIAAQFQKFYVSSLKEGKHSGISDKFGKASALLVPPIPEPTPISSGLEPKNDSDFQNKAQILQNSMRKFCQNFLSRYLEDGRNGINGNSLRIALSRGSDDSAAKESLVLKELVCASLFIAVLDQGDVDEVPKWLQSFLGHSFIRSDQIIELPKAESIAYTYGEMEDYEICKKVAERAVKSLGVNSYCDEAVLPLYQFLYRSGAQRRDLIQEVLSQ